MKDLRTIGVEEELLLVDAEDGHPVAGSGRVVSAATAPPYDREQGEVALELQQELVETNTAPVVTLNALEDQVRILRQRARAAAIAQGCDVVALGTSPVAAHPHLGDSEHYRWIGDAYQVTAREQLICALQVHVGVDSHDEGVGVLDRIRGWLPVLLALSVNSPYWQGEDSGFASHRAQVVARWPSSGPTAAFGSADRYHQLVEAMIGMDALRGRAMVYFDARLSAHVPTIEVRVADVCQRVEDTVAIAGLVRALVTTAAAAWRAGETVPPLPTELIRLGTWQASRDGLAGRLLHPLHGGQRPAWEMVDELVAHVGPALADAGDQERVLTGLSRLRHDGTGAEMQRRTFAATGSLAAVVAEAVRQTHE